MSPAHRLALIERLADLICERASDQTSLVAVDGPDASGKTTLANELAGLITTRRRPVTRVELDSFLNPRAVRYRRGLNSAEGFLEDSYDFEALTRRVLVPVTSGDQRIVRRVFDRASDAPVIVDPELVADNAIVIVDGGFLLSRRLRRFWRTSILLEVTREERLARALSRDTERLGDAASIVERYEQRYFPGFELYLERERPEEAATIIVNNTVPSRPVLMPGADVAEDLPPSPR